MAIHHRAPIFYNSVYVCLINSEWSTPRYIKYNWKLSAHFTCDPAKQQSETTCYFALQSLVHWCHCTLIGLYELNTNLFGTFWDTILHIKQFKVLYLFGTLWSNSRAYGNCSEQVHVASRVGTLGCDVVHFILYSV